MLAVPEGALTVLPRFAPVNGCERDEKTFLATEECLPPVERHHRALLDGVLARRVMKDPSVMDDVGLGGVKVAAGRIDAQRPTRLSIGFPGGEPHRVTKEPGDRVEVQRRPDAVSSPIARGRFFVRKRNQARAFIAPEGIGLRRPIQIPARSGKSTEMVLGGLVVFE